MRLHVIVGVAKPVSEVGDETKGAKEKKKKRKSQEAIEVMFVIRICNLRVNADGTSQLDNVIKERGK